MKNRKLPRLTWTTISLLVILILTACNVPPLQQEDGGDGLPTLTPTTGPAPTSAVTLAPTLPPDAGDALPADSGGDGGTTTGDAEGGPTPLPAPTLIGSDSGEGEADGGEADSGGDSGDTTGDAAEPTADIPDPARDRGGPGISLNPALGEPGEVTVVSGSGFEAGETVTLHWGKPGKDTGPEYWSVEASEQGNFEVGLIVPPADQWYNGAGEGDYLELRAVADSLDFNYYWASFRWIERFDPVETLALEFENPDWDYSITVPYGWTWTWAGEDSHNVRFSSGTGRGTGWIRIATTTNVDAAISAIMDAEGLTEASREDKVLGNFPGTQVNLADGDYVWFIPARERVYVLFIKDDNGNMFETSMKTFKVL
jgi:hypothetical protein